jgi:hypothetical protein
MLLLHRRKAAVLVAIAWGCIGYLNFLHHLVSQSATLDPIALRPLHVAVLCGGAALGTAVALGWRLPRARAGLLAAAVSTTIALTTAEWLLSPSSLTQRVEWVGGTVPHPVLGDAYAPHSVARTIYPSNPRGYFRVSDPADSVWSLAANDGGSDARLIRPADSAVVRVEIDRAEIPVGWHIQLSHLGVDLRRGERYRVEFRVRASGARPIGYGVTQSRSPWQGLGWYEERTVGPEWTRIQAEFTASRSESAGRIIWDLGASPLPVELADVSLVHLPSGASVIRPAPPRYFVEYAFNDRGCRGRSYAVPVPGEVARRILALGDSFTLGVGVHEEDTFSRQLENRLNASYGGPGRSFEVINCGVSGYSTAQERTLFEVIGPVYQPDVVLLAMVWNDEVSWREELQAANRVLDRTFLVLPLIKSALMSPPFTNSMRELLRLRDLTRRANIPLVVVIFRHTPMLPEWRKLHESVEVTLADTGVPWLDVGDALGASHDWRALAVHQVDGHPNEVAHAGAAEQIAALLARHGIVP